MNRYRVLLMLAVVLATATGSPAQDRLLSPRKTAEKLVDPPQDARFDSPGYPKQAYEKCVDPSATEWQTQIIYGPLAAWQRIRALCAPNQKNSASCDAAAGCIVGVAASVKCCEVAQAPKGCACAKACACCEACKASREKSVQAQPMSAEMMRRLAGLHGVAVPQPFPLATVPPHHGSGVVQVVPVPGIRVVHVAQHHAKPVHFVTPELDAHCERMHHQGDVVVLEGNVLMVCKKHAQPIRIEAHRVIVNMRDGSFRVESNAHPMPVPTTFGVQRTSAVEERNAYRTTAGSGIRIVVPMLGPVPCANDAPATVPTRSAEPQCPARINAEELFRHLMQYYR